MNTIQLSIIVPVYNVEKYLEKCINSLLKQDVENYEIICVNDGSTDNSKRILEKYKKNKNFIIINQSNKGLSGARNTGLQNANGKYIMFVDSDDFLKENSLKLLLEKMYLMDLELLGYNFINYYSEENFAVEPRNIKQNEAICGLEYLRELSIDKRFCPMSWLYIYNKDFLINNKLFFKESIIHEDVEFIIRLMIKTSRISFINCPIYFYRKRENSITTSKKYNPLKLKSYFEIIKTYENALYEIEDLELKDIIKKRLVICSNLIINEITTISKKNNISLTTNQKEKVRLILNENGEIRIKLFTRTKLLFELFLIIKAIKNNYINPYFYNN